MTLFGKKVAGTIALGLPSRGDLLNGAYGS
jgi:hypothetical protein